MEHRDWGKGGGGVKEEKEIYNAAPSAALFNLDGQVHPALSATTLARKQEGEATEEGNLSKRKNMKGGGEDI